MAEGEKSSTDEESLANNKVRTVGWLEEAFLFPDRWTYLPLPPRIATQLLGPLNEWLVTNDWHLNKRRFGCGLIPQLQCIVEANPQ